jgi:hypothetical protein
MAIDQVPCKDVLTRIVFEAHQTLSGMNARNQEAFRGVIDQLRVKLDGR